MSKQYPVRGMGPNLKKVLLATVSAAVAGASASAAFAQEAATAEVDEIVEVILFAASPENGFMTGQTLAADGGITSI